MKKTANLNLWPPQAQAHMYMSIHTHTCKYTDTNVCTPYTCTSQKRRRKRRGEEGLRRRETRRKRSQRRMGRKLLLGMPIVKETPSPRLLGHAFCKGVSTMEHEPQNGQEVW